MLQNIENQAQEFTDFCPILSQMVFNPTETEKVVTIDIMTETANPND